MRNVIGSPVEGEDFFDRERERRQMWRRLESDSLLLLAPRRIGKTSLMRKLCAEAHEQSEAGDFHAFSLSFAACGDELACVRELAKALAEANPKLVDSFQERLRQQLPSLKSLKFGPFGIELAQNEAADWRSLGEALARTIGNLEGRWLIAVDEVPVFLLGLLKRDDGLARVRAFLYWWRDLRQQHHKRIRWILAGSIGLDTVAARHGIGDTVNDLVPTPLGAFDADTADRFLVALAKGAGLELSEPVRQAIITALEWPVPYYLQIVFDRLRDHAEAGATPTVALVEKIFAELLEPAHKGYFDYWRQRLKDELGSPEDVQAIHLLNHCARDPAGARRETLAQALAEQIRDPEPREARLRYLLDVLESDGYLIELDGRWRFRMALLRRYWLKRVAS